MKWHLSAGRWIARHVILLTCAVIVASGGGYYAYGKFFLAPVQAKYVIGTVKRGMVIASVSATGQIAVSDQIDIKPKVSGAVTSVAVKEGDEVPAGTVLFRIDTQAAAKAVRDAEANLLGAEIALEKIRRPADSYSLLQAENAASQATQGRQNAEDGLTKAYEDGFTAVANAFVDLPAIMSGMDGILVSTTVNGGQTNAYAYADLVKTYFDPIDTFRDSALSSYRAARTAYAKNLADYKDLTRDAPREKIAALVAETRDSARSISESIKNAKNFLDTVSDTLARSAPTTRLPSLLATHGNSLQAYTGTVNGHLDRLLAAQTALRTESDALENSAHTIAEKTQAVADLKAGADALDVKAQELAVRQRENALADARENLADCAVRAPFGGLVAKLDVKKGDTLSSGAVAATVITPDRAAEVSLNEVDVARVMVGQKATLTFDAIPDTTVAARVTEVDAIGTVAQGVVSYGVKIVPDAPDARIRPGMSVSAAIVTETKDGVLMVPGSAVKSQGGRAYVEVADIRGLAGDAFAPEGVLLEGVPERHAVEAGLAGDDATEIVSGLTEGDTVVIRTIAETAPAATGGASALGGLRIPGLGGGAGGFRGR